MSLCAIIPVASAVSANASLEAQGFGKQCFSVPLYNNGSVAYLGLHAWNDLAFSTAVKAIAGVVWEESGGKPRTRFIALVDSLGVRWGANAPLLPDDGIVLPNSLYRWKDDKELYTVIQQHDRTTYGGDPNQYPALIIKTRDPYKLYEWYQTGQFDAFKVVNPVTGDNDECMFNGQHWYVTAGDGAGNNIYPPNVYGWSLTDPTPLQSFWSWFSDSFL